MFVFSPDTCNLNSKSKTYEIIAQSYLSFKYYEGDLKNSAFMVYWNIRIFYGITYESRCLIRRRAARKQQPFTIKVAGEE